MFLNNNSISDLEFSKKNSSKVLFKIKDDIEINSFREKSKLVPEIDKDYVFDNETTKAILMGLKYNKRVLIQGFHGTGKSTHIEQVAARLNWPCVRINLDGHIGKVDLLGKDTIILENDFRNVRKQLETI